MLWTTVFALLVSQSLPLSSVTNDNEWLTRETLPACTHTYGKLACMPGCARCCRKIIVWWRRILAWTYEITMHWLRHRAVIFVCKCIGGTINALTFLSSCCSHGQLLQVLYHRPSCIPRCSGIQLVMLILECLKPDTFNYYQGHIEILPWMMKNGHVVIYLLVSFFGKVLSASKFVSYWLIL